MVHLFAALLVSFFRRVKYADNKLVFAVLMKVGNVKSKRTIAAGVPTCKLVVHIHRALPIHSAEMQKDAFAEHILR